MNELLLLQIILGIFIWFNTMITFTLFRELVISEPMAPTKWYIRYFAYLIGFIISFFTWPLATFKLNK